MAWLSLSAWPGCYLLPPRSVQSHSQAPAASHPDTCNLTLLVDCLSSAVLPTFFACHPARAISLLVTLSWIPFTLDFHALPCSQIQLQHMPPHTSSLFHCWDFLSPYHSPLFSMCYILARSAFMLSSLLDLSLGRSVSKSHKSDPELCPQYSYICTSFCLHDVQYSSVSLYSLVCLSPCIISYLTLRLEVFVGKETYLHPASAESPEQWDS